MNCNRWLVFGLILVSPSCAPAQRSPRIPKYPPQEIPAGKAAVALPEIPAEAPRRLLTTLGAVTIEGVSFDTRTHRLQVLDQTRGPGSVWPDSAKAGASVNALAAINAGFFTPEGAPLGLLVSSGTPAGSWNSASSLGNALWYRDAGGRSAIARRETIGQAAAKGMPDLLQAGPLLVGSGNAVSGLEATKISARSFLLWDGGSRWMMARSSPCTLLELARTLAEHQPGGWPVRYALNLDGGRSSELWISTAVNGGPSFTRPIWNNPVRNFLVLRPNHP